MRTSALVSTNDPKLIAWKAWKETEEYKNLRRWALREEHVDGSMWAAYEYGYRLAALPPKITGGE